MASPLITELETEVAEMVTVAKSAKALIDGFAARLQAGIDAATAGGATATELAVLAQFKADLDAEGNALAAAVTQNTPAA